MNVLQKRDLLINVAFYALIGFIVLLLYKYIFPIVLPFILGFLVAYISVKISQRLKIKNKLIKILIAIIIYGTIGTLVGFGSLKLITNVYEFCLAIPSLYENQVLPYISEIVDWVTLTFEELDPSIVYTIQMILDNMGSVFRNLIGSVSGKAVDFFSGFISSVPSVFLSTLLMIISSLFFIADYDHIQLFFRNYVPHVWQQRCISVKLYIKNTLLVVLRSYFLIMLLTFTELSILFFIFGIKNGLIIAAIIAVFDIMPILGTGGIIIPWAIISFLMKDIMMGIKLLAIYGIITMIRNYVEPKIVGAQLGLHPIITLISMFVGLRLFGFIGMFGIPITISYLWKKYKEDNMECDKEVV